MFNKIKLIMATKSRRDLASSNHFTTHHPELSLIHQALEPHRTQHKLSWLTHTIWLRVTYSTRASPPISSLRSQLTRYFLWPGYPPTSPKCRIYISAPCLRLLTSAIISISHKSKSSFKTSKCLSIFIMSPAPAVSVIHKCWHSVVNVQIAADWMSV